MSSPKLAPGSPSAAPAAAASSAPADAKATASPKLAADQAPVAPPLKSVALYVGDLSADVTEATLFDVFNVVGPVASIRVCRDQQTRRSLGYAYVNYHNLADAERAFDTMNYTPIKGIPCRIMWPMPNPAVRKTGLGNVFVDNLDPSIDNKALADTFSLFGDILSCKVVTDRNGKSRGYGFVHFETVEAADEAIAKINGMLIEGKEVYVGKFIKRKETPGQPAWTNVHVKNIPLHWDDQRLEQEFSPCGAITSCTIKRDEAGASKGFGFVNFAEHADAEKAVATLNEKVVLTKLGEEAGPTEDADEPAEAAKEGEAAKADAPAPAEGDAADKPKAEGEAAEEKPAGEAAAPKKKPLKTQILMVARHQSKAERERELTQKMEALKVERVSQYQGVNLFVKNLHESIDDDALRREFAPYGAITSARVMADRSLPPTGEDAEGNPIYPSKGFGFVCFSSPEEASKAASELHQKMVMGKPLYVALAQRKDQRRTQLELHHGQQRGGMVGGRGMVMNPMQGYPGASVYFQAPMQSGGMVPPQGMGGMRHMGGGMPYMPQQGQMMGGGMSPRSGMPMGGPMGGSSRSGGPMQPGFPGAGGARGGPYPMYQQQPGGPGMPMGMMVGNVSAAGRARRSNASRQQGAAAGGAGATGGQRQARVPGAPMVNMPGMVKGYPGQQMYQNPNVAQMMRGPEPLTAAALANATEEQQKNMIGERLFPLVSAVQPQLAGKITGMLLEIENSDLLHLLESPEALNDKITEALQVLEAHDGVQGAPQEGAAE